MLLKQDKKGRPFLQGSCCASRIFSHSTQAWRLPQLWSTLLDTLFADPHALLNFVQAAEREGGLAVLLHRIRSSTPSTAPVPAASPASAPVKVQLGPNAMRPSA
jgi:hypothetical protein